MIYFWYWFVDRGDCLFGELAPAQLTSANGNIR